MLNLVIIFLGELELGCISMHLNYVGCVIWGEVHLRLHKIISGELKLLHQTCFIRRHW